MNPTKKLLVGMTVLSALSNVGFAQDFPGFRSSNYAGVNGVFTNPANAADSRFHWDFNLLSVNANVGNNNASYKLSTVNEFFKDDSLISKLFPLNNRPANALVALAVHAPSVLFNVNPKTSFAITTRVRGFGNVNDVDSKIVNTIREQDGITYPYTNGSTNNMRLAINGWAEAGLTFGRVLQDKGKHFFKAGITLRYLGGIGNSYAQINNLRGTVVEDAGGKGKFLTDASGLLGVGASGVDINADNLSANDFTKLEARGIGGDLGFVYEFRPDFEKYQNADGSWKRNKTKYKLKIGVSLLDFGKIKYNTDANNTGLYDVHIPAGQAFYLNELNGKYINEYNGVLQSYPQYFTPKATASSYSVSLPTTVNIDVDYRIAKRIFINAAGFISTVKSASKPFNALYSSSVSVTPRYESSVFDFYVPVTYNTLTKFNAGAGLRVGPLFLGSGSVLSALLDKSKQADAYVGIHVGIQHKSKKTKKTVEEPAPAAPVEVKKPVAAIASKDTDGDGISDENDKCPTVKGSAANQGCPVGDKDNDGIPDDQDECPEVAGVALYHGCPVPDTDKDGIKDDVDKCPTVPGLAKYNGCPAPDTDKDGIVDDEDKCPTIAGIAKYNGCPIPDTDGDGVNDEEDKCPSVAGAKENNGCPVIKKETIAKVEKAAKNIYFQSGKAVILAASNAQLNEVVKVLKADTTLNIAVNGHTDNTGKAEANLKVSQQRADAVKAYFVKKGVAASRITATGYGDTKPVAPNTTVAGRQKNRRVELTLRNY
ncbi:DUF5723 family protein [Chitinophagaceae bacterium 26-R-25]|nr:DUF5723 family protein [Chitinophagaceae bacterium 26-R-25]